MPTALIVDDEPDANALLGMLMKLKGYRPLPAFDGRSALAIAEADPPDVALLDLMLPDLIGFEVCRGIRADPRTALVPVIFLSARLSERNQAESLRAGAAAFVAKPFRPDQLFAALEAASAWRRTVEAPPSERPVPLEQSAEADRVRALAILRCQLVGRSPMGPGPAEGIVEMIEGLAESASAWGASRGVERVAVLSYFLAPDALRVTLRDLSDWFEAGRPPVDPETLRPDLLPEVTVEEDGRKLILTRRFEAVTDP